jgi:hypothetical protein
VGAKKNALAALETPRSTVHERRLTNVDDHHVNPLLDTSRRRELADLERDYRHELLDVDERERLRERVLALRVKLHHPTVTRRSHER